MNLLLIMARLLTMPEGNDLEKRTGKNPYFDASRKFQMGSAQWWVDVVLGDGGVRQASATVSGPLTVPLGIAALRRGSASRSYIQ